MRFCRNSNKALVLAIIHSFSHSADVTHHHLSKFSLKDWKRTEFWLDASGLALYFLDHIQSMSIEEAIPAALLKRLEDKLHDNRSRRTAMFQEFIAINEMFQKHAIVFANLKGFTLAPESCPKPELRHQLDFDFLVDPAQALICRELLEQRGYKLIGNSGLAWEFMANNDSAFTMDDHYKPRPFRSVELHFGADTAESTKLQRDPRLDRRVAWNHSEGPSFPVLSPEDQMIGQALHILGHLKKETSKPSWLLEYRNHVRARFSDVAFLKTVQSIAESTPNAQRALALSTLVATDLFGAFAPEQLNLWTVAKLSPALRLWAGQYGRLGVLADFPGTKLYLILDAELDDDDAASNARRIRRLVPIQSVPRVLATSPKDNILARFYKDGVQMRYMIFRLSFHVREGLRYWLEARRWRQLKKETMGVKI